MNNVELWSQLVPNFSWVLIVGEPLVISEANRRVSAAQFAVSLLQGGFRSTEVKGKGQTTPSGCGARVVSGCESRAQRLKRLGIESLNVGFADWHRRMGTPGSTCGSP